MFIVPSVAFVLKVYGVDWDVNEDAYGLYNGWHATEDQLLEMVLFNGIKELEHCCSRFKF